MIHPRRKFLNFAALGAAALAMGQVPLISPARAAIGKAEIPADPKSVRFRVLWKGDDIGHHNVTVTPTADGHGMSVVTSIRMKVKVGLSPPSTTNMTARKPGATGCCRAWSARPMTMATI
jgi:hypothetical protein